MASNLKITGPQRARLAAKISKPNMKSIALAFLGLDDEIIGNLDDAKKDDFEAFNREVLKQWEYKNIGSNHVKVPKLVVFLTHMCC